MGQVKILEKVKSFWTKGKNEVVKSAIISKEVIDSSLLENQRKTLYRELGEHVYKQYTEGQYASDSSLVNICEKLDVVSDRLDEKRTKISDLKKSGRE